MDSGCLEPGESMDQEFNMEKELLPQELIWLMDELLNREVFRDDIQLLLRLHMSGCLADGISSVSDCVHLHSH